MYRQRFLSLLALLVAPRVLIAQTAPQREFPLKYVGPPTAAPITPGDLMTRLYIFADDSMMGRQVGTEYNLKATAYIEREVRRMGLKPAGDSGTYFQNIPFYTRAFDTTSTVTVDGVVYKGGTDFIAVAPGKPRQVTDARVAFGGMLYDSVEAPLADSVRGKILVVQPFAPPPGFNQQAFVQSSGFRAWQQALGSVAIVVTIIGDRIPQFTLRAITSPSMVRMGAPPTARETPYQQFSVTSRVAEAMLGMPVANAVKGALGKTVTTDVRVIDVPRPGRNVVAILPGSDPKLSEQYVAIGAHNDHIGFRSASADHDSVRAYMQVVRPQGADSPNRRPTDDEMARVRSLADSLRKLHPARRDSIYNGADDDGSGSMSVLEVAETFASGKEKPKRSILFIWHTGEEQGLFGADWFTEHPTVPRDSIVAQLNMDMVGRGGANDVTGETKEGGLLRGGPGYVQLVGSRRLSTELGDLIEAVNSEKKLGLTFDYAMDANGHPQNIYCRSDHYEYAKFGIPIVFFTTGGHADYHQVTDEPQYIDYQRLAQVSTLVYESAMKLGNLDHRIVVDKPKPDPRGQCVQ